MWQLFIVTFLDWWGNPIWSSLIKFDPFWTDLIKKNQKHGMSADGSDPKKSKNKMAIFILFKNVTTLYTNIFWYVQPLKSSQTQTDADRQTQTERRTDIEAQIVV